MNLYQQLVPLMTNMAHSHTALGALGEFCAMRMLQASGRYEVSNAHVGENRGDLRAIDLFTGAVYRIEVKTARKGKDGHWRFCCYKSGKTDYRHADYVVLLAVLASGHFVTFLLPVAQVQATHIVISSHPQDYAGKYAQFRQARADREGLVI